MKYKIARLEDNIYQIFERQHVGENWVSTRLPTTPINYDWEEGWSVVFQGTLPECDAWISLHENGYL
jgi:hypothetical protein